LLYFASTAGGDGSFGQVLNRQAAFVPRSGAPGGPETLTLAQAWALGPPGVFLFLAQGPANEDDLVRSIRFLLDQPLFAATRVLWIANPDSRLDQWKLTALRLRDLTPTGGTVAAFTSFALRNYGVCVEDGCAVSLNGTDAFRIAAASGRPESVFLTVQNGAVRLPLLTGPVGIPFTGSAAGSLQFLMAIPAANPAVDLLDIRCRFFHRAANLAGNDLLSSSDHPIFDTVSAGFSMLATLDPLFPTDPARTSFTLPEINSPQPSFYRSNVNRPLTLKPRQGSRLVFAAKPTLPNASVRDPLYLVPEGRFDIAGTGEPATLMCGVSGYEFVELNVGSTLTFQSNQPAYALSFQPESEEAESDEPSLPAFSGVATTAWAAVNAPAAHLVYSAVPEGAGYFRSAALDGGLRPYFPACAAFLPAVSDRPSAYPLVPYAGVKARDLTVHRLMETRVLSLHRRRTIHGINTHAPVRPVNLLAAAAPAVTQIGTLTPQGLLAQFSADRATWASLQLGQSLAGPIAFQSIDDPLRSALLTHQQFLVISSAAAFQEHFGQNNVVDIEDWKFQLDPARWGRFGTVLIIKNHVKSLKELIGNPSAWTLAEEFNVSVLETRRRVLEILAQAESRSPRQPDNPKLPLPGGDPDFEYFAGTVLNDPGWNGVLFLNCVVDLPHELDGIASGLDASTFFAHHLGINQTPVPEDSLAAAHSSLFGVIRYDEPPGHLAAGTYDFRVQSLRVVFRNSVMANFGCTVALAMNELFGSKVLLAPGAGTAVLLDGSYEKHGDTQAFVLAGKTPATFLLNDAVLERVRITKVRFGPRLDPRRQAGGAAGDAVLSRFTFWGELAFRELRPGGAPFDLFSYSKLSFSNLGLNAAFSASAGQSFEFDASDLSFDPAESQARAASLVSRFPLKLKGFMVSMDSGKPPAGYATIGLPFEKKKLSRTWYGLLFDLNLGTLGELAANAGITASLVAVWSPSVESPAILAGLKLPGLTGGESQFSLMGVLKLKMHSLELVGSGGAYQLLINGINLSFLGKALPPGGSFDLYIFGDPDPPPGSNTVGWYGAFKKLG
jgi:hypothetical protein